jgi:hypothetical protein
LPNFPVKNMGDLWTKLKGSYSNKYFFILHKWQVEFRVNVWRKDGYRKKDEIYEIVA